MNGYLSPFGIRRVKNYNIKKGKSVDSQKAYSLKL
jgi:hypothetical protein